MWFYVYVDCLFSFLSYCISTHSGGLTSTHLGCISTHSSWLLDLSMLSGERGKKELVGVSARC